MHGNVHEMNFFVNFSNDITFAEFTLWTFSILPILYP